MVDSSEVGDECVDPRGWVKDREPVTIGASAGAIGGGPGVDLISCSILALDELASACSGARGSQTIRC